MNWLHYLLEANLYLAVFYAVYYLLLSRETYYTLNRVYLLFSCVISFVLPMLQLDMLKSMDQPVIAAATVTQSAFEVQPFNTYPVQFVPVAEPRFTLADGLLYAYFAGTVVLLLILLVKLYRLYKLTRVENFGTGDDCKVIYLDRSTTAFSFW